MCNLSGTTTATHFHIPWAGTGSNVATCDHDQGRDDSGSIVSSFEWSLDCRGSHAGSVEARIGWFTAGSDHLRNDCTFRQTNFSASFLHLICAVFKNKSQFTVALIVVGLTTPVIADLINDSPVTQGAPTTCFCKYSSGIDEKLEDLSSLKVCGDRENTAVFA